MIILLSVLLTISICVNIYLGISADRLYDKIDTLSNWMMEYKKQAENTLIKLKEIDDRQIFEKDDEVGFVFSEIVKLIEKLNKRTE